MISVIVPVYNVENYLSKCISSILSQTYNDFEIILVDDGSTDSSGVICDKFSLDYDKIFVIHKNNGGLSSARNEGLIYSKGEYITFVDSDDILHPNALEIFIDTILNTDSDIVFSDLYRFYNYETLNLSNFDHNYSIKTFNNYQAMNILINNTIKSIVPSCAKIYKRTIFNNIKFPLNRFHEDEFVIHKLLFSANKVTYINLPLYFYNRSNLNSICAKKIDDKRFTDKIEAYLDRINFIKNYYNEIYNNSLIIILNNCCFLMNQYKKDISSICYKNCLKRIKSYAYEAINLKLIKPWTNFDIFCLLYPSFILLFRILKKIYLLCKKKC